MVRRFKKIKQTRKRGGAASERSRSKSPNSRSDSNRGRLTNSRSALNRRGKNSRGNSANSRRANTGRPKDPTPEEKKIARDILSRTETFVTMTHTQQEYACFEYARKFIRDGTVGKLFDPRKYLSDTIYIDLAKVIFEKYGVEGYMPLIESYGKELKKHPDINFSIFERGGQFMIHKSQQELSRIDIPTPIEFVGNSFNIRDAALTVASAFPIDKDPERRKALLDTFIQQFDNLKVLNKIRYVQFIIDYRKLVSDLGRTPKQIEFEKLFAKYDIRSP
jgi:hypothetical protein